jgi:hypothetical protein
MGLDERVRRLSHARSPMVVARDATGSDSCLLLHRSCSFRVMGVLQLPVAV